VAVVRREAARVVLVEELHLVARGLKSSEEVLEGKGRKRWRIREGTRKCELFGKHEHENECEERARERERESYSEGVTREVRMCATHLARVVACKKCGTTRGSISGPTNRQDGRNWIRCVWRIAALLEIFVIIACPVLTHNMAERVPH
jgi:hypothetical protein